MYNWLFEESVRYNKDIKGDCICGLGGWSMEYEGDESR